MLLLIKPDVRFLFIIYHIICFVKFIWRVDKPMIFTQLLEPAWFHVINQAINIDFVVVTSCISLFPFRYSA